MNKQTTARTFYNSWGTASPASPDCMPLSETGSLRFIDDGRLKMQSNGAKPRGQHFTIQLNKARRKAAECGCSKNQFSFHISKSFCSRQYFCLLPLTVRLSLLQCLLCQETPISHYTLVNHLLASYTFNFCHCSLSPTSVVCGKLKPQRILVLHSCMGFHFLLIMCPHYKQGV